MEGNFFKRTDDVYADARELSDKYRLTGDDTLSNILIALDEESYGRHSPHNTLIFKEKIDGKTAEEVGSELVLLAQQASCFDVHNFVGYLELALTDAFGVESAKLIAQSLRAASLAIDRDVTLAMSPELATLLVGTLVDHWFNSGGSRNDDRVALFVQDALAERWHIPPRLMYPAIKQATRQRDWGVDM